MESEFFYHWIFFISICQFQDDHFEKETKSNKEKRNTHKTKIEASVFAINIVHFSIILIYRHKQFFEAHCCIRFAITKTRKND